MSIISDIPSKKDIKHIRNSVLTTVIPPLLVVFALCFVGIFYTEHTLHAFLLSDVILLFLLFYIQYRYVKRLSEIALHYGLSSENIFQNELKIAELETELELQQKKNQELKEELVVENRFNEQFIKMNMKFENQQKELMLYNEKLEEERARSSRLMHDLQQQNEEIQSINSDLKSKQEIISRQNEELKQTLEVVHNQHVRISEINKDTRDGLQYAKTIQAAIMPSDMQLRASFDEYFLIFEPKDIVGGDFYYLNRIDNHLIFALADSTGHGIPGGFMSMLGISFLHDIVSKKQAQSTGEVLNKMRERVKEIFSKTDSFNQNGLDIALCAIDTQTDVLQYSGAFSPMLLIRNETMTEYKSTRNPVGIYPKEVPFENIEIQLSPDDRIYLYTDGFADQTGHSTSKKLGTKNFKNALFSLHTQSFYNQKLMLSKMFRDWKGQQEQTDDVTVLGIHWKPMAKSQKPKFSQPL